MAIQITIRDVPEKVRDELAARAALQGKSMQEYLRAELERLAERPSIDAWLEQVRKRKRASQTRVSPRPDTQTTRRRPTLSAVVDASVLVAALIDSDPHGEWAEGVLAAGSLHAPELARVEATNILRRLERAKEITTAEANGAYEDLMQLNLELFAFHPFADRVWELRHNVTSYDAWYVAIAEALRLPLATLDTRLAKAKGPNCDFLTPG